MPEDPPKPGMPVEFEITEEQWCSLRITDDGTVVRVKPVIVSVQRLEQRDHEGLPVYRIEAALVATVNPPQAADDLDKKKRPKTKTKAQTRK